MSDLNERQLVALVQEQLPYDTRFFQQLIKPYLPMLKGYCVKLLNEQADAEDVVQDVVIKVLLHLKEFKWVVSFRAWLFKIAHNECLNKIKARRWDKYDTNEDAIDNLVVETTESPTNPTLLNDLVEKLSFIDRHIILLRYRTNLGFQEIADICDMKLSAVKMRHKRAIELLSEQQQSQ